MSKRAVKAFLEEKIEEVSDSESEEDESSEEAQINPFDLLDEDDEDDEEEIIKKPNKPKKKKPKVPNDSTIPKPKSGGKKKPAKPKPKANNKKANQKNKKNNQKKQNLDELIQSISDQYQESPSNNNNNLDKQKYQSLFAIDTANLNEQNEYRRLFGNKTVNELAKEKKSEAKKRNGKQPIIKKKSILVNANDNWPRMASGVSMDFIESIDGINYFKIIWNQEYKDIQKQYFRLVQTGDPRAFQQLLEYSPYHIDSLLQLSELCIKTNDFQTATDMLERCLYCFECSFHNLFQIRTGFNRLSFEEQANKYIQTLSKKGCPRTALEFSKFIFSLDITDPLFVTGFIDFFAIRSREYKFILNLPFCDELKERNLMIQPNIAFSVALAKFYLEQEENENFEDLNENLKNETSDQLLKNAVKMFPQVLPLLMKKNNLTLSGNVINLLDHPYFQNCESSEAIDYLVTVFTERNYTVWKPDIVINWLSKNVEQVINQVDSGNDDVLMMKEKVLKTFENTPDYLYRSMMLSEFTQEIASLPPDVAEALQAEMRGQGPNYDVMYEPPVMVPELPENLQGVDNAFALFLQSLLPWNQVEQVPQQPNDN